MIPRTKRDLLRMWDDNGKAIVATVALVTPGMVAAGVEWSSMDTLPFIERCMCSFGYFCIVSVIWLIAINFIVNKLERKNK